MKGERSNPLIRHAVVARELRHDVRNQLSALRTTLAVLELSVDAPQRFTRNLHACSGVLDRLTAEIHEYFALETGEPVSVEFDLDRLMAEIVQTLIDPAKAAGTEIEFSRPPSVTICSRPVLVRMALKHTMRALMRMATKRIVITVAAAQGVATAAIAFSRSDNLPQPSGEEIREDLSAARECLAICGGGLDLTSSRLSISLPIAGPT